MAQTLVVQSGEKEALCLTLERLYGPTPQCRECLDAASVLGRDFTGSVLAQVLGLSPAELPGQLAEAVAAGVVAPDDTAPGCYSFVQHAMWDAIYRDIPSQTRASWHTKAGMALQNCHGDGPDAYSSESAHHYAAALLCRGVLGWQR